MSDTNNNTVSSDSNQIQDTDYLDSLSIPTPSYPALRYKWNITTLDIINKPLSGTVIKAYVCVSEDGDTITMNNVRFVVDLNAPNPDSFIPLEDLSEAVVLNWIFNQLGGYSINMWEEALTRQLEASKVESITPSWVMSRPNITTFENLAEPNDIPPAVIEGQEPINVDISTNFTPPEIIPVVVPPSPSSLSAEE